MYFTQDDEDAAIVRRCRTGDLNAFELLVARYQRVLFNVALRMLGSRDDATDAAQNTFVKVYTSLETFDPNRRFFSWTYRILMNECLNVLRARRVEPPDTPPPAPAGPLDSVEASERRGCIQRAILALPFEYRRVIVLRHYADMTYEEISAALGIPVKTVKSRLYTARQRLGQALLDWSPRP